MISMISTQNYTEDTRNRLRSIRVEYGTHLGSSGLSNGYCDTGCTNRTNLPVEALLKL